jgi:4a-hydroxytetrahydrobiopterin dehydratase
MGEFYCGFGSRVEQNLNSQWLQIANAMCYIHANRQEFMSGLAEKDCVPCRGGVARLQGNELAALRQQLPTGWQVRDEHQLEKEFTFKDFRDALAFTNRVGELAEAQGHHPDIYLAWGKVKLTIWTHQVDGLTESDFIMAAKADRLMK